MRRFLVIGIVFLGAILLSACSGDNGDITTISDIEAQKNFAVGTVPRIDITTNGGVVISSKDEYVTGTFNLQDSENPSDNYSSNSINVRLRGNTSNQFSDKKSFKLKFNEKVDLCGFGSDKEWGLINSSLDYSFIRNFLAYRLGKLLNFDFSPDCKFVELYLNNEYNGLYLLTELVKTGSSRVDIEEDKYESDSPFYDITLQSIPFLLELDFKIYEEGTLDVDYFTLDSETFNGQDDEPLAFSTKYPKNFSSNTITSTQYQYIKNSVIELYSCVEGEDYADIIDVDSFIDYFIVQELFRNIDIEHASVFFYKEPGGKIKFGPLWDFDLSLGNYRYGNYAETKDRWMSDINRGNRLFNKLMQKESFQTKFIARYNELCENIIPGMINSINQITTDLSSYVDSNEAKWDVINNHFVDWLTPDWIYTIKTFDGHTSYISRFLDYRYRWIKSQLQQGKFPTVR